LIPAASCANSSIASGSRLPWPQSITAVFIVAP
jgi:hypothetical protein